MKCNTYKNNVIKTLKSGGVGVIPTDTLYGLVGSAFSKSAIRRIYQIKKRNPKKNLIVLISSVNDLKKFGISSSLIRANRRILERVWPGKVSVVLNKTAFRLPKNKKLIEILKKTGPLVAPSANIEGMKPAQNITEAKKYFGDKVDFYLAGRNLKSEPSTLIKINKMGRIEVLRGKL